MAIGPDGTAYVVTTQQSGDDTLSILRYSSSGTPLGTLDVDVDYPSAVAVAPNGTIYVSTAFDGILVLSPDGSTQTIDLDHPANIVIGNDGRIYAAATSMDADGNVTGSITVIKRVPAGSRIV